MQTVPNQFNPNHQADNFNGHGTSDILLYDAVNGDATIWFMNGGTITSTVQVGVAASPWSIVK